MTASTKKEASKTQAGKCAKEAPNATEERNKEEKAKGESQGTKRKTIQNDVTTAAEESMRGEMERVVWQAKTKTKRYWGEIGTVFLVETTHTEHLCCTSTRGNLCQTPSDMAGDTAPMYTCIHVR